MSHTDHSGTFSDADRRFMAQALTLARRGVTHVEPNPAVGAVIVRGGRIIGRGWHRQYGDAHAEVDALRSAQKAGHSVAGATIYVTLEPCCHTGKTPPCTLALLQAKIGRVVIATMDCCEKVAGQGITQLRREGLTVEIGCMQAESRSLNAWFHYVHATGRPWVVAKWAQTLDGKFACRTGHSRWITGPDAREEVHRLRRSCQAIVTGIATVEADDPEMTVRHVPPSPAGAPARVVLDSQLRISMTRKLLKTIDAAPLWIITTPRHAKGQRAKELLAAGARVLPVPRTTAGLSLPAVLKTLMDRGCERILVEAGPTLVSAFLKNDLLNELRVFVSPKLAIDSHAKQLAGLAPKTANRLNEHFEFVDGEPATRFGADLSLTLRRKTLP